MDASLFYRMDASPYRLQKDSMVKSDKALYGCSLMVELYIVLQSHKGTLKSSD